MVLINLINRIDGTPFTYIYYKKTLIFSGYLDEYINISLCRQYDDLIIDKISFYPKSNSIRILTT